LWNWNAWLHSQAFNPPEADKYGKYRVREKDLMKDVPTSDCSDSYTYHDFDVGRFPQCPIKDCTNPLATAPYRKIYKLPYCVRHGIRIHKNSPTFVYFNGDREEDYIKARLRNFIFHKQYVEKHIFQSPAKAEKWRLGYENSEDAVSWNVFVGIMRAEALSHAMSWLAGRKIDGEPELYLWGSHIDLDSNSHDFYPPLCQARKSIEPDIRRFWTEPDVMLIVPEKFVMCIEVKFTSGNKLAQVEKEKESAGQKPKSVKGIIERYFTQNTFWKDRSKYIQPKDINHNKFHGQLFRNIVFASGMAEKFDGDWQVVNLVSSTQWNKRASTMDTDYENPSDVVRCYLMDQYKQRFTFQTWEELFAHVIKGNDSLQDVAEYMKGKSAFFNQAFAL
jgi:hypothetical protein